MVSGCYEANFTEIHSDKFVSCLLTPEIQFCIIIVRTRWLNRKMILTELLIIPIGNKSKLYNNINVPFAYQVKITKTKQNTVG